MVTLQKLYTTGPHYKLVRSSDAANTIHSLNYQQFYNNIDQYVGWIIIDINLDIIFFDVAKHDKNYEIHIAVCNWFEGFHTTCAYLVDDVFDFTKQILIDQRGKTIVGVGPINDSEIQYYLSKVKQHKIELSEKLNNQEHQESIIETKQTVTC
jgi:hypothetical protein